MYFRRLLNDETACASYLFGCKSKATFAVVDRTSTWSTGTSASPQPGVSGSTP